jgi:hypothetical protein
MASTITQISSLIDTTFPVPGQDNDTQGFRNNFANIKIGLDRASAEINDLDIIQLGIASQLSNFTNPTAFRGSIVTATEIQSVTIANSGSITTQDLTSQGNITTNGRFIGDGSLLTNIPITNVTSLGTLASLRVAGTATIHSIVTENTLTIFNSTLTVTANNTLTITNISQIELENLKVLPKFYSNGTVNNANVNVNYRNGRYQVITLDTTSLSNTEFTISGWPTSGNYAELSLEVKFTGTPAGPIQTEFRNSCTTYAVSSTIVSIDDWVGSDFLGTAQLARSWAVYTTSSITISTPVYTYIQSVDSPTQITVFPGKRFDPGTPYYFVPKVGATLPYKISVDASPGQTLRVEQDLSSEGLYNVSNIAVAHLYSYDGGTTIYFNKLDVYN